MFSQKNINRPSDHLQSNNLHPIEVKQVPTFINTSNHSSEKLSSLT